MKVVNTRKVNDRIIQYMSREQLNSLLGMSLSAPVSMDEIIFEEPAKLESYAASFRASMKQDNVDYTEEQSLIASMIMSVLDETTGDIQQIPAVILDEIIRNGHIFRRGELESNPYFANIHFENQKQGRFELGTASLKKYELFMYNVPVNRFQGVMIPSIGACDHRFRFPYMKEGHKAWMSITPNEIFTMENSIKEAFGNVLTLGCGMGYFAYMVSEKDDVSHVTIVEKEQDVIDLFTNFILPQFAHKDKITIIKADAFDYMEQLKDGKYDFCFADIWTGHNDTVPYLKLKKLCKRFQQMKLSYWMKSPRPCGASLLWTWYQKRSFAPKIHAKSHDRCL